MLDTCWDIFDGVFEDCWLDIDIVVVVAMVTNLVQVLETFSSEASSSLASLSDLGSMGLGQLLLGLILSADGDSLGFDSLSA